MPPPPKHRSAKPRFGRIAALLSALAVVVIALAGVTGVLPSSDGTALDTSPAALTGLLAAPSTAVAETVAPVAEEPASASSKPSRPPQPDPLALPAGAGTGKRVVFSEEAQRVWLVAASGEVERSYLVSGSVTDNLQPGTYAVYSTSRWAAGIDDSGVMEYFVRFTNGPTGAAIGFHTIPTKLGEPLQSTHALGTPQSHGCIRQRTGDAIALWDFAPIGTTVVVV